MTTTWARRSAPPVRDKPLCIHGVPVSSVPSCPWSQHCGPAPSPSARQPTAATRCGGPDEAGDGESQGVLSIQEVAKLLNVPVSAIYAWNRRGVGPPFYKVGRKLRYRKKQRA